MAAVQTTTCMRSIYSRAVCTPATQQPRLLAQRQCSMHLARTHYRTVQAITQTNGRSRMQHFRNAAAVADEQEIDGMPERDSCPPQGCLEDLEVSDIMTSPAISLLSEASVFSAMDLMVEKNISGIPVVDDDNVMLGIVSGYDLLALESTPGRLDDSVGFFPPIGRCKQLYGGDSKKMWEEFNAMQNALRNARGKSVGEAMHEAVTVTPDTSIITAANKIVQRKLNRLVVVDHEGKLAGILSRGDIMRATINHFRWQMDLEEAAEGRGESFESC